MPCDKFKFDDQYSQRMPHDRNDILANLEVASITSMSPIMSIIANRDRITKQEIVAIDYPPERIIQLSEEKNDLLSDIWSKLSAKHLKIVSKKVNPITDEDMKKIKRHLSTECTMHHITSKSLFETMKGASDLKVTKSHSKAYINAITTKKG